MHRLKYKDKPKHKKGMKNMKKLFCIILILTSLCFIGCSSKDQPSQNTSSIQLDAYKAKISYCMELISSLKDELALAKQDAYIQNAEYEQQIFALEQRIASLLKESGTQSSAPPTDESQPIDTEPSLPERAEQSFEYKKVNGGIRITKYTGTQTDVEIPESIEGLPVIEIGESAFSQSKVTSVRIPEGVRELDWFTFYCCSSLCTVILPTSVVSIEYGVFDHTSPELVIVCPRGSYAEAYAKSWGFNVVVE